MDRSSRAALPQPVAPRLRRPTWRDPRLLFGILLVSGSVALGAWAVNSGQQTVGVFQAAKALPPGSAVSADSLLVVQVRGTGLAGKYLMAADGAPDGLVALRTVGEGEFIPRAALGDVSKMEDRPVAVPVDVSIADAVSAGSLVDLWFIPEAERQGIVAPAAGSATDGDAEPYELAAGLTVARVTTQSGGLMPGSGGVLHVLVPKDGMADVLAALSGRGAVSVVPVPGGVR